MTKKHFIKLAAIVKELRRVQDNVNSAGIVNLLENDICEFCRENSDNFDADRFIAACQSD
jgi:hypothetical protein